jgi:hypothetical protein
MRELLSFHIVLIRGTILKDSIVISGAVWQLHRNESSYYMK